jgi:phosphatidylserine decarboxylase
VVIDSGALMTGTTDSHPRDVKSRSHGMGRWLPHHQATLTTWVNRLIESAEHASAGKEPHPVISEFRDLIDRDPVVRMYLTQMIEQAPVVKRPADPRLFFPVNLRSLDQLLRLLDHVLGQSLPFGGSEFPFVGFPINAILDWCMGTPVGNAAFRNEAVNAMFHKVLDAFGSFLSSPESRYVINDSPTGWKCAEAISLTGMSDFVYDPADRYWGFASWNDFFIRRFKDGARPIADPDDDKVIVSSCESTPYAIGTNAKRHDNFWIKAQPYSLQDMLANDALTDQFVGGTVYQAFLDAYNYHRWHAPVGGTIHSAYLVPGTYYSEADAEGEDPVAPNHSQGYIAHVAARALIFIEADDPAIGLMCLIPVGMAEVSSCVIDPKIRPGYKVAKGEEIGYFLFGGSTHCLVFRPGSISNFSLGAIPAGVTSPDPPVVRLGARIATAN